jgi:hypothetical protein
MASLDDREARLRRREEIKAAASAEAAAVTTKGTTAAATKGVAAAAAGARAAGAAATFAAEEQDEDSDVDDGYAVKGGGGSSWEKVEEKAEGRKQNGKKPWSRAMISAKVKQLDRLETIKEHDVSAKKRLVPRKLVDLDTADKQRRMQPHKGMQFNSMEQFKLHVFEWAELKRKSGKWTKLNVSLATWKCAGTLTGTNTNCPGCISASFTFVAAKGGSSSSSSSSSTGAMDDSESSDSESSDSDSESSDSDKHYYDSSDDEPFGGAAPGVRIGVIKVKSFVKCRQNCQGRQVSGTNKVSMTAYPSDVLTNIVMEQITWHDALTLTRKQVKNMFRPYCRRLPTDNQVYRIRKKVQNTLLGTADECMLWLEDFVNDRSDKGDFCEMETMDSIEYKGHLIAQYKKELAKLNAAAKKRNKKTEKHNATHPNNKRAFEKIVKYKESDVDLTTLTEKGPWLKTWIWFPRATMDLIKNDFYNKVVQMDATHGRNDETQGTFFSAGILSAEHKYLLLAYMWDYENEKAATWNYFMDKLVAQNKELNHSDVHFIADMERTIRNAVLTYAPEATYFSDKRHRQEAANKGMSAEGAKQFRKMMDAKTTARVAQVKARLSGKDLDYVNTTLLDKQQFQACSAIKDDTVSSNGAEGDNNATVLNDVRNHNPAQALRARVWEYKKKIDHLKQWLNSDSYDQAVLGGHSTKYFDRKIKPLRETRAARLTVVMAADEKSATVRDMDNPAFSNTVSIIDPDGLDFDSAKLGLTCTCVDAKFHEGIIPCACMFAFCSTAGLNINDYLHEFHRAEYAQAQIKTMTSVEFLDIQAKKREPGALLLARECQSRRGAPNKHKRKKSSMEKAAKKAMKKNK